MPIFCNASDEVSSTWNTNAMHSQLGDSISPKRHVDYASLDLCFFKCESGKAARTPGVKPVATGARVATDQESTVASGFIPRFCDLRGVNSCDSWHKASRYGVPVATESQSLQGCQSLRVNHQVM